MRTILLICVACVWIAPAFAVDQVKPDTYCDGSTYEIVECQKAQLAVLDKRLNVAYRKALGAAQPKQGEQLRVAQRLWLKYRDANCEYYELGEGTIARIEGGECMLNLTRTRAKELETALEP